MTNTAFSPFGDQSARSAAGFGDPFGPQFSEFQGVLGQSHWDAPQRLTLSFAPDGTQVAGYTSALYSKFAGLLSAAEMERQIITAFQNWARRANLNIGVVSDNGAAFGSTGPTQGDLRFGDIRIGAIPMAPDVFAVAVRNDAMVSGTWAGDVFFNTNAIFATVRDFYSVTLHEAGHVFGLGHSTDPVSAMHATNRSNSISFADTTNLRAIYGARALDINEWNSPNNSFNDASRIENAGSLKGQVPLVVFGDIGNMNDVDFFELPPLSNYAGSITFQVRSDQRSVLRFRLDVYNENQQLLGSVISAAARTRGDNLSVTIPVAQEGTTYFAKISAADSSINGTGSYSITAKFNQNVLASHLSKLNSVQTGDFAFLEQDDIRKIFLQPNPSFDDDLQLNNTFGTATVLDTVVGFQSGFFYRNDASLSLTTDIDFYSIRAPNSMPNGTALTISTTAFNRLGVIPDVRVFDSNRVRVDAKTLVNGNGELVVQVSSTVPGASYFVRVAADDPNSFGLGNYRIQARFGGVPVQTTRFATGVVTQTAPTVYNTLYVAQSQMFHIALRASGNVGTTSHNLWTTIFNTSGQIVYRGLTIDREIRTNKSIVLRPGSYVIKTEFVLAPGTPQQGFSLQFNLDGMTVTDTTGPELVNPATMPFPHCTPSPTVFCYPNDVHTDDPYLIVGGKAVSTTTEPITPPLSDPNLVYWQ